MKKLMILLALTCLAAGGCVQMQMDTVIEADGSGTLTMSYAMSPSVAEALAELSEIPGNEAGDAPTMDDFDVKKIREACQNHGCKLKKFEMKDDQTGVSFEIAFPSLQALSEALSEGGTGDSGMGGFALYRLADGNYAIDSYEPKSRPADEEAETEEEMDMEEAMAEMDPEAMQKSMAVMGKLMGSMGELDIRMSMTVPGDFVKQNAHRVEGRTAIWEINSSNMMDPSAQAEPEIVFSGAGLKIKALEK